MHVSHPYHDERAGSSYEASQARDAIVSAYQRTMTTNARDALALNERTEA